MGVSETRERPSEVTDPTTLLLREDVGECYDALARSVAAALGAASCHLALYDQDTDELIACRPSYGSPQQHVPQFRFPLESAPASARVVRSGQAYVSNLPAKDPLYQPS